MTSIFIPQSHQGQTGKGQGGWTCHQLVAAIGQPATVALRNPIPLDTELDVVQTAPGRWIVVDPTQPDVTILEAARWDLDFASTAPISIEQAAEARHHFPLPAEEHPAPHCLSCGLGERSLRVHPGPLGDGRWATPWRAPEWSLTPAGAVDDGLLWMAMDCCCGWYTSMQGPYQRGVTVQFAVQIHEPLLPETDYALVAWHGDYAPQWEGRKRGAAAVLFDSNGTTVAQSRSFWLTVPD